VMGDDCALKPAGPALIDDWASWRQTLIKTGGNEHVPHVQVDHASKNTLPCRIDQPRWWSPRPATDPGRSAPPEESDSESKLGLHRYPLAITYTRRV